MNGNLVNRNFINGKDAYLEFGVVALDKSVDLIFMFPAKKPLSFNWPDKPGLDVHLPGMQPDINEVTLKCLFFAETATQFYAKRDLFIQELFAPGWKTWLNTDKGKEVYFFYDNAKNPSLPRGRIYNVENVVIPFDLTITVNPTEPFFNDYRVRILNPDGTLHQYVDPGGAFTIPGTLVTPTVSITSVTVSRHTVTVEATVTAGFTLQYSRDAGNNWQSTKTFENVLSNIPAGQIKARVVGTDITATWNFEVVITYTYPAPAETIVITNVTPDAANGNKLIVQATTENTVKAVEYSLTGGAWQSSNILDAPNGTYSSITARLIGTTISDVWDFAVTVAVVPPPDTLYNTILKPKEGSNGVTYGGPPETAFMFNVPFPQSSQVYPMRMNIVVNDFAMGSVNFNSNAQGQTCSVKADDGLLYTATFQDGLVNFTR